MRTSAWIAVTAVSLSAISVSYAKGAVPETTNGLEPLAPITAGEPTTNPVPEPTASQQEPSSQPEPSSSSEAPAGSSGTGTTKPNPKPTKTSGSDSTATTAPKPTTPPPPPEPVIKTVNSDVMTYKYGNLQLAVTFKDATITGVQVLIGDTNNGRADAYVALIKASVAAQGTKFGNYTGATYTTAVFKEALANAIAKR